MMADKHGIVRLTRVAQVRTLRLSRAAEAAQSAHAAALVARDRAQENLDRQQQLVVDARLMFARDPACPQAKLWLTHTAALVGIRAEAVIEAESEADVAEGIRVEAIRAMARHHARSERIADHHRSLLRIDRLHAETLAELDAPTGIRQVAL